MDDRIRAGRAGTAGEPEAAGPPTASSAMPTLTSSPRSPGPRPACGQANCRWPECQKIAREFSATDIIDARGEEASRPCLT